RFHAAITLVKDGMEVNGKSIMGIMMLAAGKGALLTLRAAGEDAPQALDSLSALVAERVGERE
ncbi:MAG: HPr family phosphocarrier protein, partial [Nitrospirae bacterium]|nr:HPr family phosphocarrier protein [Nitrospirota bacterium]